jgi:hypothetical protein
MAVADSRVMMKFGGGFEVILFRFIDIPFCV